MCLPGETVHNLCHLVRGLHDPKNVKNVALKGERSLQVCAHLGEGLASGAESATNWLCSPRQFTSRLWWARREHRSTLPTQAPAPLPREREGLQPGSQHELFFGCDSQQVRGVFPPGHRTCLQFQAPSVPLLSPPEVGLLRGRVLMPGHRPRAPFLVTVSGVPCTQPRGPVHATSVHNDKETRVRSGAGRGPAQPLSAISPGLGGSSHGPPAPSQGCESS